MDKFNTGALIVGWITLIAVGLLIAAGLLYSIVEFAQERWHAHKSFKLRLYELTDLRRKYHRQLIELWKLATANKELQQEIQGLSKTEPATLQVELQRQQRLENLRVQLYCPLCDCSNCVYLKQIDKQEKTTHPQPPTSASYENTTHQSGY